MVILRFNLFTTYKNKNDKTADDISIAVNIQNLKKRTVFVKKIGKLLWFVITFY